MLDKIKFWVGLAGAIVTALLDYFGPGGTLGHVLTIASLLITAVAVYAFPNLEGVNALRAKLTRAQEAGRL